MLSNNLFSASLSRSSSMAGCSYTRKQNPSKKAKRRWTRWSEHLKYCKRTLWHTDANKKIIICMENTRRFFISLKSWCWRSNGLYVNWCDLQKKISDILFFSINEWNDPYRYYLTMPLNLFEIIIQNGLSTWEITLKLPPELINWNYILVSVLHNTALKDTH